VQSERIENLESRGENKIKETEVILPANSSLTLENKI
jgi:hypothetical protein